MRTVLKWIGAIALAIVVGLSLVSLLARSSDGPIGAFAGGPLVEGERLEEGLSNWSSYEGVSEIDMQLLEPPRSRRLWLLVDEGNLYLPSGWVRSMPFWKHWPHQAQADGRALLRIEGRIYPVELVKVENDDLRWNLARKLSAKYDLPVPDSSPDPEELWIFRADARGRP